MSLGDYLRLLRAKQGGVTPWDIEAATDLPKGLYRQMEQRYRAVGDDSAISELAKFYKVPFEDLRWRLEWSRKSLSHSLVAVAKDDLPITLNLWNGQVITGKITWWDLGAIGLTTPDDTSLVVMRHAVERWHPRADESGEQDAEAAPETEEEA